MGYPPVATNVIFTEDGRVGTAQIELAQSHYHRLAIPQNVRGRTGNRTLDAAVMRTPAPGAGASSPAASRTSARVLWASANGTPSTGFGEPRSGSNGRWLCGMLAALRAVGQRSRPRIALVRSYRRVSRAIDRVVRRAEAEIL